MHAQHVEIGVVARARVGEHTDFKHLVALVALQRLALGDAVLGLDVQVVDIGQHREHRHAGFLFEPVEAGFEQPDVAAEAVDHEAAHAPLLALS